MSGLHSAQTVSQGIHIAHALTYADKAARIAASGLVEADEGKIARQLDDDSFWVLIDYAGPTWVLLSLGGSNTKMYELTAATTDATPTEMLRLGSLRLAIPSNASWFYEVRLVGRQSTSGDEAVYGFRGLINNDGGTTAVIDSETYYTYESDVAWAATATADDTNDALKIEVTGAAATNVDWVATVLVTEVAS